MRRLPPEPIPIFAPLSRWLAWGGIAFTLLSVAAVRFGGVPARNGLFLLGLGIVLAVLAMVAATLAFVSIWRTGAPGLGQAGKGLALAAVLLAWPAAMAVTAARLPIANDITTDPSDPPSFSRSRAAQDARQGHVPAEYDRQRGTEQWDDYADVRTITIEQPPEDAMALARRAATNLGWLIVDQANPTGRTSTGRIDAVARSLIFRFPDDITIRIRPGAGETRIDLRSVSRIGRHDFGANAGHIRAFAREIEELASQR